jgi:hypothetical protein
MIFGKIKLYLYSAIGALVAGLLIAVKFLAGRNARLRAKNKIATAEAKHAKEVLEADIDAEIEGDIRLANALRELNDSGHTDELSNPNEWDDE